MGAVGILLLLAVVGLVLWLLGIVVPVAIVLLCVGVVGAFIVYLAGPYRARAHRY